MLSRFTKPMFCTARTVPACLLACALSATLPGAASAQDQNRIALALSGGITTYDLAGTGTAGVAEAAAYLPVLSFFVVEAGLGFLRYDQYDDPQLSSHVSYLLPELSFQVQVPGRVANPYLGGGAGLAVVVEGRSATDMTLHAVLGVRAWLGARWGARSEVRLRSIDPFAGNTFDFTVGIQYRL